MLCPKCGVALRIREAVTRVEGDESPHTETKVYTVQRMECRNPACEEFGRVVTTVEHPVKLG